MKNILEKLFQQQHLSFKEAYDVLGQISEGKYNPMEISSFLTVYRMRNVAVEELAGFRSCLQERCLTIDLHEFDPIDLCGTGGDGKNTFNISTLAAFIVAGTGYKVAKHGNYGVSSISGSSNLLEYLGIQFSTDEARIKRQLDQAGICILHAPLFHPAIRKVAPIRKAIGVRTFFNMLGPLVNPASPQKQLIGVYDLQLLRYYKHLLQVEDGLAYRLVHSFDGYDEVSLTSETKVISPEGEYLLVPENVVKQRFQAEDLYGGVSIQEAVSIFLKILQGQGTSAQNAVVTTNAALAIQCYTNQPLAECRQMAIDTLYSGRAFQTFKKLHAL